MSSSSPEASSSPPLMNNRPYKQSPSNKISNNNTLIRRSSDHSQNSSHTNDNHNDFNITTTTTTQHTPTYESSSPSPAQNESTQQLGSMLTQLSLSAITVTLYIPTSAVGAVIGRRGQTIAHLQKTAAQASSNPKVPVRISVREPETPTYTPLDASDELWTPVVVKADPLAAWSACEQIQALVEAGGFVEHEDIIVDIPLHRNKHATVVGKRGWTVATLSADHAVRILVPHKELRHDIVQLEGPFSNVRACFAALLQVLVAPATLIVPVLPSQTKLRHIGRKTDTVLRKTKLEDGTWQLTVTGAGHVPAAMAMLQKWKEELQYPSSSTKQSAAAVRKSRNNTSAKMPARLKEVAESGQ
jgi:predicted RNA-binding protein YlqC (UPF0109 family)